MGKSLLVFILLPPFILVSSFPLFAGDKAATLRQEGGQTAEGVARVNESDHRMPIAFPQISQGSQRQRAALLRGRGSIPGQIHLLSADGEVDPKDMKIRVFDKAAIEVLRRMAADSLNRKLASVREDMDWPSFSESWLLDVISRVHDLELYHAVTTDANGRFSVSPSTDKFMLFALCDRLMDGYREGDHFLLILDRRKIASGGILLSNENLFLEQPSAALVSIVDAKVDFKVALAQKIVTLKKEIIRGGIDPFASLARIGGEFDSAENRPVWLTSARISSGGEIQLNGRGIGIKAINDYFDNLRRMRGVEILREYKKSSRNERFDFRVILDLRPKTTDVDVNPPLDEAWQLFTKRMGKAQEVNSMRLESTVSQVARAVSPLARLNRLKRVGRKHYTIQSISVAFKNVAMKDLEKFVDSLSKTPQVFLLRAEIKTRRAIIPPRVPVRLPANLSPFEPPQHIIQHKIATKPNPAPVPKDKPHRGLAFDAVFEVGSIEAKN